MVENKIDGIFCFLKLCLFFALSSPSLCWNKHLKNIASQTFIQIQLSLFINSQLFLSFLSYKCNKNCNRFCFYVTIFRSSVISRIAFDLAMLTPFNVFPFYISPVFLFLFGFRFHLFVHSSFVFVVSFVYMRFLLFCATCSSHIQLVISFSNFQCFHWFELEFRNHIKYLQRDKTAKQQRKETSHKKQCTSIKQCTTYIYITNATIATKNQSQCMHSLYVDFFP